MRIRKFGTTIARHSKKKKNNLHFKMKSNHGNSRDDMCLKQKNAEEN